MLFVASSAVEPFLSAPVISILADLSFLNVLVERSRLTDSPQVACDMATVAHGLIANYASSTDVSTHAMIDLDAKEIEEYSDAGEWESALFVYENGGGGLCSAADIAAAVSGDACFEKTTSDAKGNSIKGSGEIRTIQGFATSGRSKMAAEPFWNMYRDYWNDDNYADTFIQDALSSSGAWALRSTALRAELSAKGAKYQAVWMYVIHEMEDAVADCKNGDIFDNQASNAAGDAPHAWDEAWAFYAGSLEGVDGSGTGYLLHDLAEKRCSQFGTCNDVGGAIANDKALAIANVGLEKILAADCDGVAAEIPKFVVQMTIPVIQGMLRYVYLADPAVNGDSCSNGACDYDKPWAEAWAFAAAVLPQIAQCDATVAAEIVENLDVDTPVGAPLVDGFAYVKGLVESTYSCLGITCADIGDLIDSDTGLVIPGMEGCSRVVVVVKESSKKTTKTDNGAVLGLAVAFAIVALIAIALGATLFYQNTRFEPSYKETSKNVLGTDNKDDDSETASIEISHV